MREADDLNPYGFTIRLHENLRTPVKMKATLQGKSIKDFVTEAVVNALEDKCHCAGDQTVA